MSRCGELAYARGVKAEPTCPWDTSDFSYWFRLEEAKKKLGTKYLLHPANQVQRKKPQKSVLHDVRVKAVLEGRI